MGLAAAAALVLPVVAGVLLTRDEAPPAPVSDVVAGPPSVPQPTYGLPADTPTPTPTSTPSPARTTGKYARNLTTSSIKPSSPSPSPSQSPASDRSRSPEYRSFVNPLNKCVEVLGGGTGDGDVVQQWSCHGADNQRWAFRPADAGTYAIVNATSGKCLDVYATDRRDGARVHQWSCYDGASQQWWLEPAGNGYFLVINRNSGKCLDVHGYDSRDGARVQQWSCNGGANQQFTRG